MLGTLRDTVIPAVWLAWSGCALCRLLCHAISARLIKFSWDLRLCKPAMESSELLRLVSLRIRKAPDMVLVYALVKPACGTLLLFAQHDSGSHTMRGGVVVPDSRLSNYVRNVVGSSALLGPGASDLMLNETDEIYWIRTLRDMIAMGYALIEIGSLQSLDAGRHEQKNRTVGRAQRSFNQ